MQIVYFGKNMDLYVHDHSNPKTSNTSKLWVAKANFHIGLRMVLTYVDTICGKTIPHKKIILCQTRQHNIGWQYSRLRRDICSTQP